MFNSSDRLTELINDDSLLRIGDIANCVTGFYSGDDKKYLRPLNYEIKNARKYSLAESSSLCFSQLTKEEKQYGIESSRCFVPIVKGGNTKYLKSDSWFMNWSREAINEYRQSKKCRFQNSSYYFRNGIGIPMIRSSRLTGALISNRLFDQSIVGVFPKDESLVYYLLAFFNSSICTKLINAINPSTNNSANYIKKIPFITPTENIRKEIENLTEQILVRLENGNNHIDDLEQNINNIFDELYSNKQRAYTKISKKLESEQLNLFHYL